MRQRLIMLYFNHSVGNVHSLRYLRKSKTFIIPQNYNIPLLLRQLFECLRKVIKQLLTLLIRYGSFLGQLLSYGLMATTILWITPAAVRGLLIGLYAKRNKYELSTVKLAAVLIVTALIVTAINTGVMYFDSVLYGYYTYAYVFGGLVVRIVSGVATAIVMVFVAPPVVKLLRNTLQQVREK